MQTLSSLEKLGLNQKEQETYVALLQLEKATANQVAYKTKIKRPTTYDILYRLKQSNFIYETTEKNKRYFMANSPQKLIKLIEEQKRNLLSDMPLLLSFYNAKVRRPKIAYFEGIEGIKQLFDDTLISCKKRNEILAYVTSETTEFLAEYVKNYIAERTKKGIIIRGIYNKSKKIIAYLKHDREQLRKSKIVDTKKSLFKNEINIYANKMIIITYHPEPFGVLIESKEIADTQRTIFELAWKGIK